jgi:chromosome segregation ATPase
MEFSAVPMKKVRKPMTDEEKTAFVARMKEGKMRAAERRLAARTPLRESTDHIADLAQAKKEYRQLRTEQDALVAEIDGADNNFTRINLQISELEVRRAALRHRMRELDNQEARLATSMIALEEYIHELENAIAAAGGGEP